MIRAGLCIFLALGVTLIKLVVNLISYLIGKRKSKDNEKTGERDS
jgi:heme exporter protein D